jgi:hypothetical protein
LSVSPSYWATSARRSPLFPSQANAPTIKHHSGDHGERGE